LAIVLATTASGLSMAFRFVAERRLRVIADVICQSHMELLLATEKARALQAFDCEPVQYTREVFGDTTAPFVASCSILRNQPPSPSASYNRLVVEVRAPFEGREVVSTFSTYVVHR
jgi:hypothetical protein